MSVVPVHHHLVRAAAARPEALALVAPRMSYGELDRRTSALAAAFRARGVSPGDRVAICLPKSNDYVLAIFAALKARAVYVPIDATQPVSRQAAIIRDAEPALLVGEAEPLARIGVEVPATIRAEELAALSEGGTPGALDDARPEELAILLFTSGSTGVPKGVQISFENLHTFVAWAKSEMELRPDDVFSQHAGFHFDLSTFDLFAAVASGAAIWVVSDAEQKSPAALGAGLERHGVTVWYSVPSILSLMLAAGVIREPAAGRLRYVLFAGEVFPIKHLRALHALLSPDVGLYNLYGPTETNVCTWYRVGELDAARATPVPIGRVLSGCEAWIEDEAGARVEGPEAFGELMIRGPCTTPGYWRRSGYDNEANHRERIHATGDLVSLEDGEYLYRGRKDRMVKLNGFRVELGEVEAALARHPAVREVAVLAVSGESESRLHVFYAGEPWSVLAMKQHAAAHLPRYMIPHAIERLDALPKNANGKIDLLALKART